jgi:hypothetical protein
MHLLQPRNALPVEWKLKQPAIYATKVISTEIKPIGWVSHLTSSSGRNPVYLFTCLSPGAMATILETVYQEPVARNALFPGPSMYHMVNMPADEKSAPKVRGSLFALVAYLSYTWR